MAIILKKSNVQLGESRKLGYREPSSTSEVLSHIDDADAGHNMLQHNSHENVMASNVSEPDTESDLIIDDDKIVYQGKEYYDPKIIENEIESRTARLSALIEQEKLAVLDSAKEEGYSDGQKRANAEFEAKLFQINTLIDSISTAIDTKVNENIDLFQNILFISLVRILGESISHNEERIRIINNVIKSVAESTPFTLKVSHQDYEILKTSPQLIKEFHNVKVMSDNRVTLGGCILETDRGVFDGRLEVQLARLKEAIDSK